MFFPRPAAWLVLASTCGAALAQPAPAAAPAQATVAPSPYRYGLEGYQPFADQEVAPWRATNDTVGKIGGWKAYAREARGGAAAPAAAAPPSSAPAAAGGHRH